MSSVRRDINYPDSRSVKRNNRQTISLTNKACHGGTPRLLERATRQSILEGGQLLGGFDTKLRERCRVALALGRIQQLAIHRAQAIDEFAARVAANRPGFGPVPIEFPDRGIDGLVQ